MPARRVILLNRQLSASDVYAVPLSRMAGTEFLVIDRATIIRSFEAEVWANAACYRLPRGI